MKKVISLLLALALCLSVVACSSNTSSDTQQNTGDTNTSDGNTTTTTTEDGGLVINIASGYSEPHSMDPSICTGVDQAQILVHMFDGLMKYNASGEAGNNPNTQTAILGCGQAESYDYDEETLTYTFHLRDDIKWSDGKDVTAQDYVYAWQRLVDPATTATFGNMLNDIVVNAREINEGTKDPSELGVTAIDEKTLEVKLANPCAYFLDLCAAYQLYPLRQDAVESSATWTEPETYISNGAYRMVEWVHDSYIALEKNENYYDYENLGPDRIVFHLSDNQTSNFAGYQSGEYDFLSGVPTDQIESLRASGELYSNPQLVVTYLYLNVDNLPDWRVRAAITLAIDRDNIVNNVTQDGSEAATCLIPGGITLSDGTSWTEAAGGSMFAGLQEMYPDYDLSTYAGRCELAQVLYDEAVADGWDADASIDYQYNTSDTNRAIAEAVQADLNNVLGISMTLNNIDSASYTATISQGNFKVARLGNEISFNDAIGFYDYFGTNGSYEYSNWSNAEYDELKAQAKGMIGGPERDEILMEMERIMFTEGNFPLSPLYYNTYTYCMKTDIQNVSYCMGYLFNFSYATR